MSHIAQSNFSFLQSSEHDPIFFQLANNAELAFSHDPNTTLVKLRQLAEAFAKDLAARCDIFFDEKTSQKDLIYRIDRDLGLERTITSMFHTLRMEGNKATHQYRTKHREAISGLRLARELAVWFHRSFGSAGDKFNPGPFVAPPDPSAELRNLQVELEQLKAQLVAANDEAASSKALAELTAREKEEYAVLAEQMDAEARAFEAQSEEFAQQLQTQEKQFAKRLQSELKAQKESDAPKSSKALNAIGQQVKKAAKKVVLDEELTRVIIDQQLTDAGWTVDSQELRYSKGTRPEKGKNKAIAEWPTANGPADYVLFVGLTPIAAVEAKRENINVSGKIKQAERYSRGFKVNAPLKAPWEEAGLTIAWPDDQDGHYHLPFVFSCNGRPFVKQLAEQSGTWFRDVRHPSNTAKPLQSFHSPQGLMDLLKRNKAQAAELLKSEPFAYLNLRDYQEDAIRAVEHNLTLGNTEALLAMATGTGKTRTIIGLMYRFLKSERFKRILFLVDRSALGNQAQDDFDEAALEQNKSLSKIYNIAKLTDKHAEAETRVQVATVQAMVKRVFASDNPPTVDEYDCIIVDEAHRGYTLDQELTEGELATRDVSQYLSSYRRVLDYFDAVKIGLTATPAKHTSEIFGHPVFTYSYREAVADDWLIDHEPPFRYETLLTQNGIQFDEGETVAAINTATGEVETAELEDELNFEVEAFNRKVITEGFNEVICQQLAKELDPLGDEKTMIFCATDSHADMVKRLLDDAFKELLEEDYNQAAVAKITGQSDKVDQLISQYKNERYPNIAITVDLLTTGIDVPKICNLVFMRRVKSRILYEQMIGRATRRCDDIGKTLFRIYDPVDIYAALEEVSTMKPLVKNPNITIDQLVDELTCPETLSKALGAPGSEAGSSHADDVLDHLNQKVMRILRKAQKKAERNPEVAQKLHELHELWGVEPHQLHQHLHKLGPREAATFLNDHGGLLSQLAEVKYLLGSEHMPVIYEGKDEFVSKTQVLHEEFVRPADYLDAFGDFIKQQINQSAALKVVVTRPRDLTREQLKEIKLLLDQEGFSEAKLDTAWRNNTNQEIAASIIGHIRRAALGEALVPFEQRVMRAMDKIYTSHNWSSVQRKWLERLAKQLAHEVVVDKDKLKQSFANHGGLVRLNKMLDDQLDTVLEEFKDYLWEVA
ncbi:type I restriction-modification system endonuclease [Ferrimonas balearica]|uniref:type I restriction-modification system endonuclease n=1 Tax=Ferrimonas balearica TaxID=44012 RepID=UPI001C5A1064|nr:type I restriction-modification system endonuclease [Ferrimonas balearica]MBW3164590.1 type I restriction-modification system endonuclease [Ferrimonas balearica]